MFTNKKIAEWILECNSIGDTIENGISANNIQDEVLAQKWAECEKLIEEIYYILEPHLDKY